MDATAKTDYASSATSFILECVELRSSDLGGGLTREVKTVMELYNGYCETANVDPRTTAAELSTVTEGPSTDTVALTAEVLRTLLPSSSALPVRKSSTSALASSTSAPTGRSGSSAAESTTKVSPNSGGLGKSDAIELGVGIGVGIPSLLLVLVGLRLQIRKRRRNARMEKDEE